ncbi:MAG TPA: plastocyanin/azurin family copper-binding protein [Acidimicrobiia bacterium]|nr:plastocyanin/azurin family copper-binding protein [Acidimicrobiia bacterium]
MRWYKRGAIAALVAIVTAFGGYAMNTTAHAQASSDFGPGLVTINVGIRYSKFSISTLHVREGTVVRFLVHNADPIHHEFIVGDASVHLRHELGTEATHPPVPGEVSIAPEDVGETFYDFDTAGKFLFACHLPGHFAYGMKGWVIVDG